MTIKVMFRGIYDNGNPTSLHHEYSDAEQETFRMGDDMGIAPIVDEPWIEAVMVEEIRRPLREVIGDKLNHRRWKGKTQINVLGVIDTADRRAGLKKLPRASAAVLEARAAVVSTVAVETRNVSRVLPSLVD